MSGPLSKSVFMTLSLMLDETALRTFSPERRWRDKGVVSLRFWVYVMCFSGLKN